MLRKFAEAVGLWRTNFLLIAPIVLTVWLPGNLLGEYLIWQVDVLGSNASGRAC
jgi:hypothetical protein